MSRYFDWTAFHAVYDVADPDVCAAAEQLFSQSVHVRILGPAKLFSCTDPAHNSAVLDALIDAQASGAIGFDYVKHARQLFLRLAKHFDEASGTSLLPALAAYTGRMTYAPGAIGKCITHDDHTRILQTCRKILSTGPENYSFEKHRAAAFLAAVAYTGCRPSSLRHRIELTPGTHVLRKGEPVAIVECSCPIICTAPVEDDDTVTVTMQSVKTRTTFTAPLAMWIAEGLSRYGTGYTSPEKSRAVENAALHLLRCITRPDVTFRALRHYVASALAAEGRTRAEIAARLGHTRTQSQNYYVHSESVLRDKGVTE